MFYTFVKCAMPLQYDVIDSILSIILKRAGVRIFKRWISWFGQ